MTERFVSHHAMFADVALARRIEDAEGDLRSSVVALLAEDAPVAPLSIALSGGTACYVGDSPSDKIVGIGFEPLDEDALAGFEREVLARGGRVQIELSTLADPRLVPRLSDLGYRLIGHENVLGKELGVETHDADFDVHPVEALEPWRSALMEGFETPDEGARPEELPRDALRRAIAAVTRTKGYEKFVAEREGVILGVAGLRVHAGIALLCGASTLPAYRRQGVQSAMLSARLTRAASLGCDLALITTAPGTKSQENAQKRGFSLLYSRSILVKDSDSRALETMP